MATFQLSGTQQPGLMTPLEGEKPTEVAKPKVAESISADQIGATPTFNVPAPKVNTSALSRLEASVQPVQTPQQEQPTQEPNQAGDIVQRQLDLIEQARGQGARSAEIMQEQQVLEKKQALDMVDQEINKRENYYERRLQKLEDQGGGLKMGLEAEINTLRRERARELADMYIVRAGKAQDYETANQYAQDLIKAEFEPIQDEIDNLSTVYNLLQNDLSESEKLQAQAQIDQKASDRDLAKSTASQVFSELANAGALTADRTRIINEAMQEASAAISNGQSPDAALAKMQGALIGVQTLAQQKMALDWSQEARLREASAQASGNEYGTVDGKPQTQAQALVQSYANRLLEAERSFKDTSQFADPLALGARLPNLLQSSERQQFEQAKRNFVNAVLRRESGAVISDTEFANAEQQYFTQPGDSEKVIKQKAQNRNTVINNFYREANVPRPVMPGDVITGDDGKQYLVGEDGETIEPI